MRRSYRALVPFIFAASLAAPSLAATVEVGNGIYRVFSDDGAGFACGAWTAATGPAHPAGPNLNVLFGGAGGFPGTSDTTLRSYTSGTDWRTDAGGGCTDICTAATSTTFELLLRDGIEVGTKLVWTLIDPGVGAIRFTQTVIVEGPVDGTETTDNSAIRETHAIENFGSATGEYGLRKHWDWQVGSDDGPWFGSCEDPTAACDRSMNLTADGTGGDAPWPTSYVINEEPLSAACPGSVVPNDPVGCSGAPVYLVAGTISEGGPTLPVDPPEMFQFNRWSSLASTCWEPALSDNAFCAFGDTAAAYFYGRTAATAIPIAAGEARNFTQYVVAALDACPVILDPSGDCTPRNHGFWHRYCLGQDAIDPGRFGIGNGPGPRRVDDEFESDLIDRANSAMSSHGIEACAALDVGPFSDELQAALRELATVHFNLESKLLSRGCAIELHPVDDTDGLTVADGLAMMESLIADGSIRALKDARWIGAHISNGEALLPVEE